MARKLAFPAAIAALALTLSACGDDDNGGDSGNGNDDKGNVEAAVAGASEDWPDTLEFISIPSEDSISLIEEYGPLLERFEEELDVSINDTQVTSYSAVIEALGAGQADIANFGPFSYVLAADTAGAVPVAVAIDGPEEPASYVSYLVTMDDRDDLNGIEDLEGQRVCFVDEVSTSGRLYPLAGMMEAGLDEDAGDYEPVWSGGHDSSVRSVINDDCDAGFVYDTMFDVQLSDETDGMKVIWESEDIPSAPFAASGDLPETMVEAMQEIMLEDFNTDVLAEAGHCDNPEPGDDDANDCSALIPGGAQWGYIEATDDVFDGIRAVCDITEADACDPD